MAGPRIYSVGDRTYEIHGLDAKAEALRDSASTAGVLIGDLAEATETALAEWRGPHAFYFANEAMSILSKHMQLRGLLLDAARMLEAFPDQAYVYPGDWPPWWTVDQSASSADVPSIRAVATALGSQNGVIASSADELNLDGVTATVTYPRALTQYEVDQRVADGADPDDLIGATVDVSDSIDPATLIHMPGDQGLPELVRNRRSILGDFAGAVADAFADAGGSGGSIELSLLALHPSLGGYLVSGGQGEMNGEAAVDVLSGYFDEFDIAADGGDTDGIVSEDDLEAMAEDPEADPLMRATARYLLDNAALYRNLETVNQVAYTDYGYGAMPAGDGNISRDDVDMFIDMRERLEVLAMNVDRLDTADDGGDPDGFVSNNDLEAIADNESLSDALRGAAQWMLDHPTQRGHLWPPETSTAGTPNGFDIDRLLARTIDDQAFTGDPLAAERFVLTLPVVDVGETGFPIDLIADESVRALANTSLTATDGDLTAQHQVIAHLPETIGAVRNQLITAFYDKMATEMDHILAGSAAGDPTIPGHPGANWMMAAPWASDGVRTAIDGSISVYGIHPDMTDRQAAADGNQWIFDDIGARYAAFIELHSGTHPPTTDQLQTFFDDNFGPGDADIRNAFVAMNAIGETTDPVARQTLLFQANAFIALHEQAGAQPWLEEISTGPDGFVVEFIDLQFGDRVDHVNRDLEPGTTRNNLILDQDILSLDIDGVDATDLATPGGTGYIGPNSHPVPDAIVLPDIGGIEHFADDFPRTFQDWHQHGGEDFEVVATPYSVDTYDVPTDPDSLDGTGANSWPDRNERMWHILKLFEQTHTDPSVWRTEEIDAGFDNGRFDWLHDETGLR